MKTEALQQLVDESVITAEQAAAVQQALWPQRTGRSMSPAAEIAGYVGGILALVAATTVAADLWTQLEVWTQFAIFAIAAVALWAGGRWLLPTDDPSVGRLGGTLWLLSTASTASAAWIACDGFLLLPEKQAALTLGLVTTAHAGVLWALRRRALQQIALFVGVMTTVGAALWLLPRPPDELYGLVVWAVGVAWALLAIGGQLAPRRTGAALGGVTAVLGAEGLTFAYETAGLLLALATVGALFAAGAMAREAVFVGLGSVALAIVLPQALSTWFPDSVSAPTALFVAGTVLLGGALSTIRTARSATASRPLES